jgi:transposase-like protein
MKIKGDKIVKVLKNGTRYVVQPEHIKIQAVKELENGELTIGEAMKKYEINRPVTIKEWLVKYSSNGQKFKVKPRLDPSIKRQAVRSIEMGYLSKKEASEKYGVVKSAIDYWIKQYSCSVSDNKQKNNKVTSDKEKELEKSLEAAKLKILALETMIDVAEKSLNIDIRKKPGTKQ